MRAYKRAVASDFAGRKAVEAQVPVDYLEKNVAEAFENSDAAVVEKVESANLEPFQTSWYPNFLRIHQPIFGFENHPFSNT